MRYFTTMNPEELLPGWTTLTDQEKEEFKKLYPQYFPKGSRKLSQKKQEEFETELLGSDHISQEELGRSYNPEDEDPLSQNNNLPQTEGGAR